METRRGQSIFSLFYRRLKNLWIEKYCGIYGRRCSKTTVKK
jgi:hypothetical protein